jgi:signal transduction histidine kinase/ActR/RegA family two-component response regulator
MARALESRLVRTLPAIGLLAGVYFVAGHFSLKLAFLNASASPVWPPAGIALAALLVFGYRLWPGVFVGAFLVNAITTGNIGTSLSIATGNTLEAFCCAWLVSRFANGTRVFDRAQDAFKFALAVIASAIISPTFGVTGLALGGFAEWADYGPVWLTWWLGDTTGALVVAPLLILWSLAPTPRWTRREAIEVVGILILMALLGEMVFGGWFPISAKNYPISFILGPILIWTAFRFSQREAATGIFILSAIAIWGTLHKFGPFIMETENQSLLILQTSTAVLSITAMALAAAMSERRRAEDAIESQKAIVEAANKTKDNFLAMLSHELRTPLTPVLVAIDALESEPNQSDDSKSALAMIRRNVELESQLIDDLLDLTRLTRDKMQLKFAPIDTHQCIEDVLEMCASEAAAKKLRVNADLRAGAHYVDADAAKFQQIIWNLLKNAIKFTGENGDIAISSANPAPQTLSIVVRDTGIGIESDLMERMFNPFEQGDRSFQRRSGGLGLGLAISKSLAEAHGATLTPSSDGPGQGSTFTLTLKTVAPRQRGMRFADPTAESSARSLRILLVDDHQDTCAALERLLIRRGHLVAAMPDMRSAMEAATRNQFDLLISDIALPDGTGTELMTCLRAISGIRGIAISGFGMNGDIQKSLQAGFSEHLVKPVKLERLEAAIHSVMGPESAPA